MYTFGLDAITCILILARIPLFICKCVRSGFIQMNKCAAFGMQIMRQALHFGLFVFPDFPVQLLLPYRLNRFDFRYNLYVLR